MNTPNPVYDQGVDSAALARMSELFDRAAVAAFCLQSFADGFYDLFVGIFFDFHR